MILSQRVETVREKKLIGKHLEMSLAQYRIEELWKSFMPRRKEIENNVDNNLISLSIYSPKHFIDFDLRNTFTRWAAVEVTDFDYIPQGLDPLLFEGGLYAVFIVKGDVIEFRKTVEYIYSTWIFNSEYALEDRPHFEILGEKYNYNHIDSEEEFWIPIKAK
jgi:AraC family transcriptional regulator